MKKLLYTDFNTYTKQLQWFQILNFYKILSPSCFACQAPKGRGKIQGVGHLFTYRLRIHVFFMNTTIVMTSRTTSSKVRIP